MAKFSEVNMKIFKKILINIILIILILLIIAGISYSLILVKNEISIQNEIINFIRNNSEDTGNYIIHLEKCDSSLNNNFYICWYIDNDGDYELSIVKYDNGHIENYEIGE